MAIPQERQKGKNMIKMMLENGNTVSGNIATLDENYIIVKRKDGYFGLRREHGRKVIHVTEHSDGTKMEGLRSISTSCRLNPFCIARSKVKGSVCEKCYAENLLKMRKGLNDWLEWNYLVLTSGILRVEDLPVINDRFFRIESFGDVANYYHATNYLNTMRRNKRTFFSVWTKNPELYDRDIREHGKPKNSFFVLSSPNVNEELSLEEVQKRYPWIDAVFTVFDDGTPSNCAGIHCMSCKNPCYGKKAVPGYRREKLR